MSDDARLRLQRALFFPVVDVNECRDKFQNNFLFIVNNFFNFYILFLVSIPPSAIAHQKALIAAGAPSGSGSSSTYQSSVPVVNNSECRADIHSTFLFIVNFIILNIF